MSCLYSVFYYSVIKKILRESMDKYINGAANQNCGAARIRTNFIYIDTGLDNSICKKFPLSCVDLKTQGKIGPWWKISVLGLQNNLVINKLSNHWFNLPEDED